MRSRWLHCTSGLRVHIAAICASAVGIAIASLVLEVKLAKTKTSAERADEHRQAQPKQHNARTQTDGRTWIQCERRGQKHVLVDHSVVVVRVFDDTIHHGELDGELEEQPTKARAIPVGQYAHDTKVQKCVRSSPTVCVRGGKKCAFSSSQGLAFQLQANATKCI